MGLGWSNYLDVSIWVLIPFTINSKLALRNLCTKVGDML